MKKALVLALVIAGVAAASASAVQRSATSPAAVTASQVTACTSGQIGFLGPITGPVAFLGKEQGNWAKWALENFNKANGTHSGSSRATRS